ncbi:UNVERIFIED_CONTAM: hypothetical protein K2H54_005400 [Gekko kuhli]
MGPAPSKKHSSKSVSSASTPVKKQKKDKSERHKSSTGNPQKSHKMSSVVLPKNSALPTISQLHSLLMHQFVLELPDIQLTPQIEVLDSPVRQLNPPVLEMNLGQHSPSVLTSEVEGTLTSTVDTDPMIDPVLQSVWMIEVDGMTIRSISIDTTHPGHL